MGVKEEKIFEGEKMTFDTDDYSHNYNILSINIFDTRSIDYYFSLF